MTTNTIFPPAPRFLIDTADAEFRWVRTLSDEDLAARRHVRGWPGSAVLAAFDFGVRAHWVEDSRFWKNGDYSEAAAFRNQLETVLRWGAGALDPTEAEDLLNFCDGLDGGLYAEEWEAFRSGPQWAALEERADDPWFSRTSSEGTLERAAYDNLVSAGFEEMLPPDVPGEAPDGMRRWVNFCALHGASLLDEAGQVVGDWADRALLVVAMACGQLPDTDLALPDWLVDAGRCWQVTALLSRGHGTGRFAVAAADANEAVARLRADLADAAAWPLRITPGRLHHEANAEAVIVPPADTLTEEA